MTNKNTVSGSVKIAPKVAPVSTSTGGVSLTQKVTLLVDLANLDMLKLLLTNFSGGVLMV